MTLRIESMPFEELWLNAYVGVTKQRMLSVDVEKLSGVGCAYRMQSDTGALLCCGIGHSIAYNEYKPEMEGKSAVSLIGKQNVTYATSRMRFLTELQSAHDSQATNFVRDKVGGMAEYMSRFMDKMMELKDTWNLTISPDDIEKAMGEHQLPLF